MTFFENPRMLFDPYNVILSLCQKSLVINHLNISLENLWRIEYAAKIGERRYQNLDFIDDRANLGKILILFMYFMNAWLRLTTVC